MKILIDENGQSLAEYSILLAVSIVIGGSAVFNGLADSILNLIAGVTSIIPISM